MFPVLVTAEKTNKKRGPLFPLSSYSSTVLSRYKSKQHSLPTQTLTRQAVRFHPQTHNDQTSSPPHHRPHRLPTRSCLLARQLRSLPHQPPVLPRHMRPLGDNGTPAKDNRNLRLREAHVHRLQASAEGVPEE